MTKNSFNWRNSGISNAENFNSQSFYLYTGGGSNKNILRFAPSNQESMIS